MKWYRFWKTVQGHNSGEYFQEFEDDIPEKDIKYVCEEWADNIPGGQNVGYSYGIEEVDRPPKEYLIKHIKYTKDYIKNSKKQLKNYEFWLNTYSLNVKIDKIKDNIKK